MCGIFGIVTTPESRLTAKALRRISDSLFRHSESRGKEASGLVWRNGAGIHVIKSPITATELISTPDYRRLFSNAEFAHPFVLIGHSRLVMSGHQHDNRNNQPVTFGHTVGVHNGIIVNHREVWDGLAGAGPKTALDSEAMMALVDHHRERLGNAADAIAESFHSVEGSASLALLFDDAPELLLATNTGSLYAFAAQDLGLFAFASEAWILRQVLKRVAPGPEGRERTIEQIGPFTGRIVNQQGLTEERFSFRMNPSLTSGRNTRRAPEVRTYQHDSRTPPDEGALRRCTRCILPTTMPFIEFDEDGVCNYCRNYRPMPVKGPEALEAALAPYRKAAGVPDCVAGFSGGRDSSYGLHLLKKELGMTPVALTYDWGMVTDLARRNQARICGSLGVDHVLVSADIDRKRGYIRKNLLAWLKKPDLGMIPLLMAGDKQMFYYMNQLRRRTGIELVVLCLNPMEKTDFKSGFCNVVQGEGTAFYHTTFLNKMRMVGYYLGNFLSNPAYLNRSLLDTAGAFVSSYFMPHNHLYLFDYLRWDEDQINQTLIDGYNWEMAKDVSTTWRIGDGTAAFYNYIYYKVAGFTENDTFRSNQIRENVINRAQALALVSEENKSRMESIREYLDLLNVDFDDTMGVIDAMPPISGAPRHGKEPSFR